MTEQFQVLSLDGGGIKGIFSAAVLAHLEEDLKIDITDYFDLIAGTSTGGIIAIGLGFGMKPKEIVQFYVDKGSQIFPDSWTRKIMRCWRRKFDSRMLESALRECFGDTLLGESRKRLVIPSYNIGEDDVYLFKTSHHKRLTRDYKTPMWKVAMATSAAPTFFSSFQDVNHVRLVDGGVWANNPTMVGIIEAVSLFNIPLDAISVFSLGTTDEVKGRSKKLDHGGFWQWKTAAVNVVMRGQSIGAVTQAQHLLGMDRVLRLNPKVPDNLFTLDRLSVKELLSKAAHESRHLSPQFEKKLTGHIAPLFEPFHQIEKEPSHA
ncbi:MAG: patatin-like phospholipase family protein [Deltaproteobacteria bacterium]|nr:patatin-like phospholipase family protein [Deltaproteobacteria bacterium]